ncbi:MAG: hypothetical protein ACI9QL_002874, partial [Candidatus Omnitrophota bacterium]
TGKVQSGGSDAPSVLEPKVSLKPKDSVPEVVHPDKAPSLNTKPVEEPESDGSPKLKLKPIDKEDKEDEEEDVPSDSVKSKFSRSLFGSVKAPKLRRK